MMKVLLPLFAVVALLSAAPPQARAADDVAAAKAHFKAGTDAYRRADYAQAIREFEAAYLARPSGVLRFNIAQAYEKLGDIPSALRNYHLYLRETPRAEDRATVEAAMQNLEKRLEERGVQQLLVYSEPSAAQVAIDGKPAGVTPLAVELKPGRHEVAVTLDGYGPAIRSVNIAPDKSLELDVALQKGSAPNLALSGPSSQAVNEPAGQLDQKPETSHPRVYTWVATGVAGAALVGAALFGTAAQNNANALRDPGQAHTHDANQSHYDAARRDQNAANLLYGVGGLAGAAAVTLFFIEGKF